MSIGERNLLICLIIVAIVVVVIPIIVHLIRLKDFKDQCAGKKPERKAKKSDHEPRKPEIEDPNIQMIKNAADASRERDRHWHGR